MNLSNDSISGELKISGTLDIDAANALREALLDCFLHQPEVAAHSLQVDLSGVDTCDAAALQVLLAARKDASAAGTAFRVNAPSQAVTETAAALGLSIDLSGDGSEKEQPNAG